MFKSRASQHIHCNRCAVKQLCIARNLPEEDVEQVNQMIGKLKIVSKGEHIFHASDPLEHLCAIYQGSCKDYKLDENGNEKIGNFYLTGDIVGLESLPQRKHLFSLVALEDTQLCLIPVTELLQLMQQNATLLQRVINITSYKMQNDQLVCMTTNAHHRIADFILNILYRLYERFGKQNEIRLPMSQLDISNYLGMAHETVNRVLRKLDHDKIINIQNKVIRIIDVDRLKALATSQERLGQTA